MNRETGDIYWFTLSEDLWDLIPERYKYLKEHYNRMLYNKSLQPERDFVKYFNDPFGKVATDVSFLELSKEELENIGFKFEDIGSKIITVTSPEGDVKNIEYEQIGTEINCGFGKNWIQYKSVDRWRFKLSERINPDAPKEYLPFYESVYYFSPNRKFVKKDWTEKQHL